MYQAPRTVPVINDILISNVRGKLYTVDNIVGLKLVCTPNFLDLCHCIFSVYIVVSLSPIDDSIALGS